MMDEDNFEKIAVKGCWYDDFEWYKLLTRQNLRKAKAILSALDNCQVKREYHHDMDDNVFLLFLLDDKQMQTLSPHKNLKFYIYEEDDNAFNGTEIHEIK